MMLFTQASGRSVVGLTTAEVLGSVTALSVSPSPARVTALKLKGHKHRDLLPWQEIEAFGPDAVTVRAGDSLQDSKEPREEAFDSRHDPMGKPVVTEAGRWVGKVTDVEFDETTGRVRRLTTTDEELAGERLVGVGGYAVVVSAA
ncbi:PRC-barrel domain-containing protein [Streptomyces caeni]|uniref:PRC-barrel domain-containing protein n=1 Tax=Streptomyces caeni TaxID=2307231 RepID=A0ABW4IX69_9ACTN